jgi:hypothetical protein
LRFEAAEPVRRDAAVAAAATLSKVPKTSMLLDEIVFELPGSVAEGIAFKLGIAPGGPSPPSCSDDADIAGVVASPADGDCGLSNVDRRLRAPAGAAGDGEAKRDIDEARRLEAAMGNCSALACLVTSVV